ncbi:2-keto-4-pentenoate hydratase [Propioniciclava tarda]|uniref:2-keto-4-pentenoate hydratase n=1 Tax=Propioniciclava tarda TaxID=433330 RepID=A0A4Q9KLU8_PROTD|nr:2-keto-4-pentenoate hydratase [Propioniciclava tarda]TBT94679.1 2-keto-4-pentenoate hydratase [Propioniciclava tarda]SMO67780.1 2-keto-4-pentenoate hydratase [Propioniciclava tarda]HOA88258.1 2-keto-4-pentenoate hydratase [Propioniciclava tarda]HQA30436.1 2-keto-4-pentenoate hydratase [Propioniciclava tarda]HQD60163.1 2-keto-4-pentenoate hydratase [Propioniciclava tarda]
MDSSLKAQAAKELLGAYASRQPIAPLTETYPDIVFEDAYEIQKLQIDQMLAGGRIVKGHKVGLTSAAMQNQLGVDQPDFGHLLDDFFFLEHMPIPMDRWLQARIEPEVAFVLGKPLKGPGVTVAEAIQAVDFVLPALEIVDSRIKDWKIGIIDTISDNASSGGVILGGSPTRLTDVDLRLVGCTLLKNGQIVGTGANGAVLGNPINSLVWLANTVGPSGVTLEPGHVVLPGSVTKMQPIAAGDTFVANWGALGSVTARFAKEN